MSLNGPLCSSIWLCVQQTSSLNKTKQLFEEGEIQKHCCLNFQPYIMRHLSRKHFPDDFFPTYINIKITNLILTKISRLKIFILKENLDKCPMGSFIVKIWSTSCSINALKTGIAWTLISCRRWSLRHILIYRNLAISG